jgi:hypothetical protein
LKKTPPGFTLPALLLAAVLAAVSAPPSARGAGLAADSADPVLDGDNSGRFTGTNHAFVAGQSGFGRALRLSPVFGVTNSHSAASFNSAGAAFPALTMSAWVNPAGVTGGSGSYALGLSGGGGWAFLRFNGLSNEVVEAGFNTGVIPAGAGSAWISSAYALPGGFAGKWTHVAGTYDNGTVALYVNGDKVAENTAAAGHGPMPAVNRFIVGANPWGPQDSAAAYAGRIDDARLMNVALPPGPVMSVEPPPGTPSAGGVASVDFGDVLAGSTSPARFYTVRNTGSRPLVLDLPPGRTGEGAGSFLVTPPPTGSTVAPGSSATFSVVFAPPSGGTRQARVVMTGNDTNAGPFSLDVAGFGIGEDRDSDADGLNDAAEFTMAALGFDFRTAQTNLVGALWQNAARAGLFTSNHVAANPAAFGLFNRAQYDSNRAAGRADVTGNPAAYHLFTSNALMDMNLGALLIQKQGGHATVVFQPQTTTDPGVLPFTNHGAPVTNHIPMPGDKGFIRIQAKPVPGP